MKRLIDDRWRVGHIPHLIRGEEYGFTEQQLAAHEVTVCVTALRFGGYLFVGVPGESLVDMTLWLRSRFSGAKTVSVDQIGGYYNYMATPRSMTLGGYTYWSSWVRRDAIRLPPSWMHLCGTERGRMAAVIALIQKTVLYAFHLTKTIQSPP